MITITLKLFAGAKDIAGRGEMQLTFEDGAKAAAVMESLATQFPKFKAWLPYLRLAVNQEYVTTDAVLHDRDEVAVIPPVSGG